MIYKYSFSISGDSFYPEKVLGNIQGDFIVNSFFKPNDTKSINVCEEYGFGSMSFWHPNKNSTEADIINYEKDFIEFIEKNYYLFIENSANEFEIFMEIYFDGGQCNFEVFNKNLLAKLAKFGVSLPMSVYVMTKKELKKWEDDINLIWKNR